MNYRIPSSLKILILSILAFIFSANISAQDLSKDSLMGVQAYKMVEQQMGFYDNPELLKLITDIGNRLVAQLDEPLFKYEFYLVDAAEPNAFAVPGGKVFVTRGLLLLPLSEDELAGVIGHEIIHSNNRHSIKQQRTSIFSSILLLPGVVVGSVVQGPVGEAAALPFLAGHQLITSGYSRSHESEADEEGVELVAKAGYQPIALANILARISAWAQFATGEAEKSSYFSSHPYTPKRVKRIQKENKKLTVSEVPPLYEKSNFLSLFDSVLIGENPANGFTQKGIFYHPKYNLKIEADSHWQSITMPNDFAFRNDSGQAMLSFSFFNDSISAEHRLEKLDKRIGNYLKQKPNDHKNISWEGYNGFMTRYLLENEGKKVWLEIFVFDLKNGKRAKIAGIFTDKYKSDVEELLASARIISTGQMPKPQVKVMRVKVAQKGDTFKVLSAPNGDNKKQISFEVLINQLPSGHVFKAGERVKIIESN